MRWDIIFYNLLNLIMIAAEYPTRCITYVIRDAANAVAHFFHFLTDSVRIAHD